MGENSAIEWTDHSLSFWFGCTNVSPACDHCYAEVMSKRFGWAEWGHGKPRVKSKSAIETAFRLDRKAAKAGRRMKVFANHLSDFFDAEVPDDWRDEAMAVMALTPNLDWLVLSKRPKVMRRYMTGNRVRFGAETLGSYECIYNAMGRLGDAGVVEPHPYRRAFPNGMPWPLPNVWLGVTAETQAMADLRIPDLLATPAAKRFVSVEPMLAPIDIAKVSFESGYAYDWLSLDWVICGGESGPHARPSHVAWEQSLRDQCRAAGVPFFRKQAGEWLHESQDNGSISYGGSPMHVWPDGTKSYRVGKARAGRLLDGREWNEVPDA